ncbi:CpsB/CapC family capsule biosynthesis tyrosine phosphatase [Caproicibacterium sp. NSD3]
MLIPKSINIAMTMNTKTNNSSFVDLHTHCLPQMDDGAKDCNMSIQMLQTLKKQGVRKVFLTPHYYPQRESLSDFLQRRSDSYRILSSFRGMADSPEAFLGAEIYLIRGLCEADLRPLCLGDTRILLLELPRQPYHAWILEELHNLTYALNIIPVLAHIERYQAYYHSGDFEELLSFEDLILQFNAGALQNRENCRFLYSLSEQGYPMLIGSDTHDMSARMPSFDKALPVLTKKRHGQELLANVQKTWANLKL